jgi:hypothetical protein
MTQIDGTCWQVFIKFTEPNFVYEILQRTNGITEFKHTAEEISLVRIEIARMGMQHIRLANLPP